MKNTVASFCLRPYPNCVSAGVDFDVARRLSRKVVWALSLPGKTAPDTAGKIIKNTMINMLEELGV